MTLTFGLNDLDQISEDALSYAISMFNDYDGIIDVFSIWHQRDDEPSNKNIHLYLDVKGFDQPKNGDENFTVYRAFRGVRSCPSELDSYEELDISEVKNVKDLNDFIHGHMRSKANA